MCSHNPCKIYRKWARIASFRLHWQSGRCCILRLQYEICGNISTFHNSEQFSLIKWLFTFRLRIDLTNATFLPTYRFRMSINHKITKLSVQKHFYYASVTNIYIFKERFAFSWRFNKSTFNWNKYVLSVSSGKIQFHIHYITVGCSTYYILPSLQKEINRLSPKNERKHFIFLNLLSCYNVEYKLLSYWLFFISFQNGKFIFEKRRIFIYFICYNLYVVY